MLTEFPLKSLRIDPVGTVSDRNDDATRNDTARIDTIRNKNGTIY
jgi:hypothetical protein